MSQEKFAEICGFDRTYISIIERGKQSPTLRNIYVFAKHLSVSMSELFVLVEQCGRER